MRRFLLLLCLSMLVLAAWYVPNRPQDPPGGSKGAKFASLSFAAYRPGESPRIDRFPTAAEVDADMALVAREAYAIRTYAAVEGQYDTAALAQKHGLKLWQGIALGTDRAKNAREIAQAVAIANRYPDTVVRVIVGNEVLLRRDLPPAELIAAIDLVKRQVRQPVAYADVWDFWKQFPQVAPHVDIMLIHLLPYWEDVPTGIGGAVAHVDDALQEMRRLFPGKQIAIGETGWPSRGRERADAVPSRINEVRFLRAFLALSRRENFDYNFIEAFDQTWKYADEGIVGANWGVFDAQRRPKFPLDGPVSEDPDWALHGLISIALGLALSVVGLRSSRAPGQRREAAICVGGMALGAALGLGGIVALDTLYDLHLKLAAAVNLAGQAALAVMAMLRVSGRFAPMPERRGWHTAAALRALVRQGRLPRLETAFEDLLFLFVWTACVMQWLLVFDPRYREFPLSSFAVPLVATVLLLWRRESPRTMPHALDLLTAGALALGALCSLVQEGALNGQSIVWNGAALVLTAPVFIRLASARRKIGGVGLPTPAALG